MYLNLSVALSQRRLDVYMYFFSIVQTFRGCKMKKQKCKREQVHKEGIPCTVLQYPSRKGEKKTFSSATVTIKKRVNRCTRRASPVHCYSTNQERKNKNPPVQCYSTHTEKREQVHKEGIPCSWISVWSKIAP